MTDELRAVDAVQRLRATVEHWPDQHIGMPHNDARATLAHIDALYAALKQEDAQVMGMQDAYLAAIAERDAARAELAAANDERARLRKALHPFSVALGEKAATDPTWKDSDTIDHDGFPEFITVGHLRAARAALTETTNAG